MALKLTRVASNCVLAARKWISRTPLRNNHRIANFNPTAPVLLAYLGVSLEKKKEKFVERNQNLLDLNSQLENADQLFMDYKYQESLHLLKSLDQSEAEVQWRLARAIFKIAETERNSSRKAEQMREGLKLASEALEKKNENFEVLNWYAILLDAKANLDGEKARLAQAETVKKHALRAIELSPDNALSQYILGERAYILADIPSYKKRLVSTLYETPPIGTYEEALEHFLKAESLQPDAYHKNKLMIGKCYYNLKNKEKAKEFLTKAANITVRNEDERLCKQEAEKLLKKIK